ncbi:protein of unknown function [Methylorubrum extorquens]|uniref:Uncharacterized protein n=1 Tax=Methylorubrum extorquens TaxID=408 RepID=A0A2N9AMS4_METEX|nr:protein of unknown function [Methylorubrum extorquens]
MVTKVVWSSTASLSEPHRASDARCFACSSRRRPVKRIVSAARRNGRSMARVRHVVRAALRASAGFPVPWVCGCGARSECIRISPSNDADRMRGAGKEALIQVKGAQYYSRSRQPSPLTSINASPLPRGMLRLMEPVSGAKSCHSTPSLSLPRRHSSPAAHRFAGCATMPTPSRSS